jgi:hypothetical protein
MLGLAKCSHVGESGEVASLMHRDKRIGWPTLALLGLVVVAFMGLSLLVTVTGTARFVTSMGHDATLGYAVGVIFEVAKASLPNGVIAFWARRSLLFAGIFGLPWGCLVTFSCLATHATVSTAISSIERTGTWKMEVRGNTKAELASVEQQLAALGRPTPPRPAATVRGALAGERVPTGIWKDSNECGSIQESIHFARACAQVVQLRRELAAALDYERLTAQAAELRNGLTKAPIVATSDPLPAAFSATLGRVLPLGGTEGIALLLTTAVEIISSFGLAGITALYRARGEQDGSGRPAEDFVTSPPLEAMQMERAQGSPTLPEPSPMAAGIGPQTLPKPCPKAAVVCPETLPEHSLGSAGAGGRKHGGREGPKAPSNILPWRPAPSSNGAFPTASGPAVGAMAAIASHVPAFAQQRLRTVKGTSIAHKELRAVYVTWCAAQGYEPLSLPRFATELSALGYGKWKSYGRIRYRDIQLVA